MSVQPTELVSKTQPEVASDAPAPEAAQDVPTPTETTSSPDPAAHQDAAEADTVSTASAFAATEANIKAESAAMLARDAAFAVPTFSDGTAALPLHHQMGRFALSNPVTVDSTSSFSGVFTMGQKPSMEMDTSLFTSLTHVPSSPESLYDPADAVGTYLHATHTGAILQAFKEEEEGWMKAVYAGDTVQGFFSIQDPHTSALYARKRLAHDAPHPMGGLLAMHPETRDDLVNHFNPAVNDYKLGEIPGSAVTIEARKMIVTHQEVASVRDAISVNSSFAYYQAYEWRPLHFRNFILPYVPPDCELVVNGPDNSVSYAQPRWRAVSPHTLDLAGLLSCSSITFANAFLAIARRSMEGSFYQYNPHLFDTFSANPTLANVKSVLARLVPRVSGDVMKTLSLISAYPNSFEVKYKLPEISRAGYSVDGIMEFLDLLLLVNLRPTVFSASPHEPLFRIMWFMSSVFPDEWQSYIANGGYSPNSPHAITRHATVDEFYTDIPYILTRAPAQPPGNLLPVMLELHRMLIPLTEQIDLATRRAAGYSTVPVRGQSSFDYHKYSAPVGQMAPRISAIITFLSSRVLGIGRRVTTSPLSPAEKSQLTAFLSDLNAHVPTVVRCLQTGIGSMDRMAFQACVTPFPCSDVRGLDGSNATPLRIQRNANPLSAVFCPRIPVTIGPGIGLATMLTSGVAGVSYGAPSSTPLVPTTSLRPKELVSALFGIMDKCEKLGVQLFRHAVTITTFDRGFLRVLSAQPGVKKNWMLPFDDLIDHRNGDPVFADVPIDFQETFDNPSFSSFVFTDPAGRAPTVTSPSAQGRILERLEAMISTGATEIMRDMTGSVSTALLRRPFIFKTDVHLGNIARSRPVNLVEEIRASSILQSVALRLLPASPFSDYSSCLVISPRYVERLDPCLLTHATSPEYFDFVTYIKTGSDGTFPATPAKRLALISVLSEIDERLYPVGANYDGYIRVYEGGPTTAQYNVTNPDATRVLWLYYFIPGAGKDIHTHSDWIRWDSKEHIIVYSEGNMIARQYARLFQTLFDIGCSSDHRPGTLTYVDVSCLIDADVTLGSVPRMAINSVIPDETILPYLSDVGIMRYSHISDVFALSDHYDSRQGKTRAMYVFPALLGQLKRLLFVRPNFLSTVVGGVDARDIRSNYVLSDVVTWETDDASNPHSYVRDCLDAGRFTRAVQTLRFYFEAGILGDDSLLQFSIAQPAHLSG